MADSNPTIVEALDFLRSLTGDACSLIKEERDVIVATIEGEPERISDVSARLAKGRKYLRDLDKVYEAAEDVCCDACERGGA
jgi:hypothetical protein